MEYDFRSIERKWQQRWKEENAYRVKNEDARPGYYVLDMFPYPSGTGLHVGHPLGYIASDIFARYKRSRGFNVLHPMGYDSFGLPAEQYALETGQHPAVTTENNIATFRQQLDRIAFSYDWSREVKTSDPAYYKWTQWIFLQLFNSWYNPDTDHAEPIATLIPRLSNFDRLSQKEQADELMQHRLAYCGYGEVNWCEALGTVLANDEVVNGVSERGGHPVVKKKLRQWYLRITAYADRLLSGLDRIEFSEAMKDMQTNWIGKSSGAEIDFAIQDTDKTLKAYTTRPDTIFGVDFMVVAPEHELIAGITTPAQHEQVEEYIRYVKSRSERERMAEKKISGVFTGAYALNPFDQRPIPIWISEYVLAGYGTGAIMAVPCGDERDFRFAKHFDLNVTNIIGSYFNGKEANPTKEAILENSGFLNGQKMKDAIEIVINRLEQQGVGKRKVNFKMRDAAFSRQRYWGEPFPIQWLPPSDSANHPTSEQGDVNRLDSLIATPLAEDSLPLELPIVKTYSAGPNGEGPLANIPEWTARHLETNTMPGYAGSSWYFLRYMDPHNDKAFCDRKASDYWGQVDLYIGGTEHAVGHLLYSRMWTKVLYDLGHIGFDEPYKKLVNQGMIQGSSRFVYRVKLSPASTDGGSANEESGSEVFISKAFFDEYALKEGAKQQAAYLQQIIPPQLLPAGDDWSFSVSPLHVDVNIVDGVELDTDAFTKWRDEFRNASFVLDNGKYICGVETEKMSKSKYNTVNPDTLVERYGADTFRMYEMFLGPVEMSKPWDTKGIEGVHRFLKKLWRLFFDETKGKIWTDEKPSDAEWKILHKAIKKTEDDNERFSFNTAVSGFMITVNELTDSRTHKKALLGQLLILLSPYAPHISEELWHALGHASSILEAPFPTLEEKYLVETAFTYPVSINGKVRTQLSFPLDASQQQVEQAVKENEVVQKWMEGKLPDKIIFVKGRMINVVIKK